VATAVFHEAGQVDRRVVLALPMQIHLVNPSDLSFGTAVITPRWRTCWPRRRPPLTERLDCRRNARPVRSATLRPGDVVGIGIHVERPSRYAIGRKARSLGATVVFGGIHATLFRTKLARTERSRDCQRWRPIWPKVWRIAPAVLHAA
jgi:hypothetical protein